MNLHALYLAICLVESGNNPGAIGRHGERGAAQISRTVWHQHMNGYAFYRCSDTPMLAKRCALKHFRWLVKNGIPETPWELAYAWNCGRTAALKRILGTAQSAAGTWYAWRVETVYNDLLTKSKRGSKPSKP